MKNVAQEECAAFPVSWLMVKEIMRFKGDTV
jgi:hypothetical protein